MKVYREIKTKYVPCRFESSRRSKKCYEIQWEIQYGNIYSASLLSVKRCKKISFLLFMHVCEAPCLPNAKRFRVEISTVHVQISYTVIILLHRRVFVFLYLFWRIICIQINNVGDRGITISIPVERNFHFAIFFEK